MYEVSIRKHFDAAHYLRGYQGKCENIHGHRYEVVVSVRTEQTDDIGLAYDFGILKKQLAEILGKLDHKCVNDVPPFDEINASAENIASTICQELQTTFKETNVQVHSVQVFESPDSAVTYFPEGA
ncbi:MAG: 6-carboxytetrahydropterin synthase QueD [Chloroflexi bacterium]|nr:6-carboxytetrahydropterin synthase QueD [Chloroflexota bacterium]